MRFLSISGLLICAGLLLASGVVRADHLRYGGIHVPSAGVVTRDGERVLLHTQGSQGHGLAWLPADAISQEQGAAPPSLEDELARAATLIDAQDWESARSVLAAAVVRFPGNRELRQRYAAVLRRLWHFEAAYVLLKSVVDEYERQQVDSTPYPILREMAEVAVLWGEEDVANKVTRGLRRRAREMGDEEEAWADALRDQFRRDADQTYKVVVIASGKAKPDRSDVMRERAKFDQTIGDCLLSAEIAEAAKTMVEGENANLSPSVRTWISAAPQGALANYMRGGSEGKLRELVDGVRLLIKVNELAWTSTFDWRKRVLLYGTNFIAQKVFPNADITVQVESYSTPNASGKVLASASYTRNGSTLTDLETREYRDDTRDRRLRLEATERQRRRGNR